jgi:hypothetical protein
MSRARGDAEFYQSHKDDVEEWGEAERGEISPNLVDGGRGFRRRPLIRRCSFRCGFRL